MSKSKIKPRPPKGMRDFLPADMLKREYVFNVVKEVFHLYGFEPLQTPVIELSETLLGKYGEESWTPGPRNLAEGTAGHTLEVGV